MTQKNETKIEDVKNIKKNKKMTDKKKSDMLLNSLKKLVDDRPVDKST